MSGLIIKSLRKNFTLKAKMLSFEEAEDLIGHTVGGICPFGVKEGVKIYLDNSLRRFKNPYILLQAAQTVQ